MNLNNKTILITGGTGSFGKEFINLVYKKYNPKKVIIYSRDELKQYELEKKLNSNKYSNLRFFIGDIRDLERLKMAMKNVNIVIHAAALKQVPTTEYNPFEAVKTNIIGAQNVIEASIEAGVRKVIALSTDKAASPINIYGATKLTSDKLFITANNYVAYNNTLFSVVRYGNVMGSRGSVIPYFLSMKKSSYLPITDINMTRFSITLEEGVNFVLYCLKHMWGGELFVPKIPSYKITDLAKAISPKAKIKIIGIRPGEKLHEEMITESDSLNTIEFKDHYVVMPNSIYMKWSREQYLKHKQNHRAKPCEIGFSYNSKMNKDFLSVKDLRELIKLNIKL